MNGGNIDEPELVAHPDLIDLDVGVGRDGVLQISDSGYQHAVDFWAPAVNRLPVADVHHLIKHAAKQDVPKLDLCLAGFYQPVGLGAAFGLVKEFVLGKGRGINHAKRNRKWVQQRRGEIALNFHLLGGAPCSEQRETERRKPPSESRRFKVENR